MTFVNMSYTHPTKQQRLSMWNDFSEKVKKDYKPKDIYFPSYNAQRLLAKWRSFGKKMTGDTYCFTEPQDNELLFINLPLCIKTISEHEALFSTILETELSPEEIARNLGVKNSPVWERILKSHLLTGLLCGFGLENAKGFHICTQPKESCSSASTRPTSVFIKNHPKFSEINIPSFGVYPGGEGVVTRYKSEREAIIAACSDHAFKKLALKKLKQKRRRDYHLEIVDPE